ncbi:hypothetical protein EC957_000203 [Mortierella hygrophila]|uniref:Uncharacterized protein n=1 Tax=Mortierella hygrophila TaxID=979708 RepID=A0A9P6FHT8_9FUNG|nr:hypothetical protein EC957_000203 [Mortierella hygrophila]
MKSISATGEEAEAAGTRAAEEKSEPRGLTPVYRFRTLDVFPRSLRHTLNDPETPTLSKAAAVASSSSSVSSFATYNAKTDDKNNNTNKNALDATTTTPRTGANYYYRHRLRRVLSVEFIHDIEADTIDVPWSSSSPPSPLLTQSPLSQQQDLENKRGHEIEHELELEHGPQQQQQEQEHQADYLTAAPAAAHASPIPLRPALTHRPPFEPNPIQIHDSQSLSVLDHDEDDDDDDDASTVLLEPFKQEPTKQEDATLVPASLDVAKPVDKTEIASLWTTQSCSSLSSSSSSLILSLSETTSAPNLDRVSSVVSFLPLPLPVPVKFVSAQGPGRVLEQPSDQSASFEKKELDEEQDPSGLTISHTINDNISHSDSHGDKHQLKDQHVSRLWPVLPYDLEVKAALDECLGDIYHFTSSAPNSAANSRYSTRTSHDDAKSVYQYEGPMDEGCDVYHDYQAPLPSPPLLKDVVATTTVTTAVADAVRMDQDKSSAASSPQQLYQQLLSSSPPVASSAGSTKSLLIASTLPLPPVAILVLDRKEPIRAAEVTEDLDSKDLPPVLLLSGQQEDLIEQYPRAMTVKRASTTEVLDKGFLNGLFAGTVSRWTRPTPTTAPVPPIMITTSAMASTTSPLLRHVNRGRGLAAQSGDLADMDPFWDF